MTLPLYTGAWRTGFPSNRTSASSVGSTLIVANTNSFALNVTSANEVPDPWIGWAAQSDASDGLLSGTEDQSSDSFVQGGYEITVPNHANIRPIRCVGWNYANFYHIYRVNLTPTTAPRIVVLGKVPYPELGTGAEAHKKWPADDDIGFPDVEDFWIPLTVPGSTDSFLDLGLVAGARLKNDMFVSAPSPYVYLQGVTEIMAFVVQVPVLGTVQEVSQTTGGATISAFSSSSSAAEDTSYGVIGVQFSG